MEEKTRTDIINESLTKYPIEQYRDWYITNYPDVYAGYMHAKEKFKPKTPEIIKEKAKISLKMLGILLGILGIAIVIVYFILIWLFNEAGTMFQ